MTLQYNIYFVFEIRINKNVNIDCNIVYATSGYISEQIFRWPGRDRFTATESPQWNIRN